MTNSLRESEAPRGRPASPRSPSQSSPTTSPAGLLQRAGAHPASLSPADVLTLQRTVGNRAVGTLLGRIAASPSSAVHRYPYVGSDPPARMDAIIYGIYEQGALGGLKLIYVGQTTDTRIGTRFVEHVDNDAGQPWHGMPMGLNEATWPYVPRTIEQLKNVTKFETTAAEQWWLERQLKAGDKLVNKVWAITQAKFNSYKTIVGNYDHKNIGVGSSWKPSV